MATATGTEPDNPRRGAPEPPRSRERVWTRCATPDLDGHRSCLASSAVYSCADFSCPDRIACEEAVSPWIPGP
jgi:hypothetical protein